MPPQKTLEERVRELEEQSESDFSDWPVAGGTIFLFVVIAAFYFAMMSEFRTANERLDRLEQSTRQTGKE